MMGLLTVGRSRDRLAAAGAFLGAIVCLALVPALAQAASWSIQTTANGAGAEHSALNDIACEPQSTEACTAVGRQTVAGVKTPYAQYWNGSTWANQSTATPAGATASELQADHCLSKTSCVAAGFYTKSGTFSLVEAWNGTSWSIQATPNPEGATETKLRGVSCKVITACIAVGQSNAGGKWAVAMRGNSGTWSLQSVPKPAKAISSELTGVECNSATSCTAVGVYNESASVYWAMAAIWNGSEWSLQTVPTPTGAKKSVLLDISCSDASNCTAVGAYTNSSSVQVTFAVRWNGTSWTHQSTPNPGGSTNSVLQNVSCNDRYSCVAVGDWINAGTWQPMAQLWNSAGWTLDTAANPASSTFALLEGVSCRITCLGIGWYTTEGKDKTLGEVRAIPSWTQQTIPETPTVSRLEGVSCAETAACVSVGYEQHAGPKDIARTFLWNGTAWSASGKPVPVGATHSRLSDVSCSSASACTAVGFYYNSEGDEKPYAARYAGGSWTVQSIPLPVGATIGRLNDVSCTASNLCRAVGGYGFGSGTLALVWNGISWSIQATPAGGDELKGISCHPGGPCLAVGNEAGGGALVLRWNGATWAAIADPPNGIVLSSVSCPGELWCAVAGWGEGGYPFASNWNGAIWSQLAQAPRLAFTEFSYFEDISCPSSLGCYAVGQSFGGSGFLAAQWSSAGWALHDVPKPSGGELMAVACASTSSCQAVGAGGSGAVAESFP